MSTGRLLVTVGLLLALASCSGGNKQCGEDSECARGQYCGLGGTCTAFCARNTDCNGGICSATGRCLPSSDGPADLGLDVRTDLTAADHRLPDGRTDGRTPSVVCNAAKSDCRDLVVSKLKLPADTAAVKAYGLTIGGQTYNALGNILMAFSSMAPELSPQVTVDETVNAGASPLLARVQASDFTDAAAASAQTWTGAPALCCPSSGTPPDPNQCASESKTTCFAGSFTFAISPSSPTSPSLSGSITAGVLSLSAATMPITLPLGGAGNITLRSVRFKGRLTAAGIADGVLAGAIPKSDVDSSLIPGLATLLDSKLTDPTVAQSTKDQLKTLFDTNQDGSITASEVADNALFKLFLAGDVDVDGDGSKELSVGLGFEAVRAVISGS